MWIKSHNAVRNDKPSTTALHDHAQRVMTHEAWPWNWQANVHTMEPHMFPEFLQNDVDLATSWIVAELPPVQIRPSLSISLCPPHLLVVLEKSGPQAVLPPPQPLPGAATRRRTAAPAPPPPDPPGGGAVGAAEGGAHGGGGAR
eukprot:231729-Chlamydomonas_euryale.AAC.1